MLIAHTLGLLIEGPQLVAGTAATIEKLGGVWPFVRLLLLTGVSHYTYNECAFVALSRTMHEHAEKIPEDHFAEAWWADVEERYAQRQRMGLGNFGPPRPC